MLLQTNSYVVPKAKRVEHARLLRRFRHVLARLGCEDFEVYEQVGQNWNAGEATGRYVQIMRFRDRKHQVQVQQSERNDPAAQSVIAEFCRLINYPYQQQQGLFAIGYYTSVLPDVPPRQVRAAASGAAPASVATDPFFPANMEGNTDAAASADVAVEDDESVDIADDSLVLDGEDPARASAPAPEPSVEAPVAEPAQAQTTGEAPDDGGPSDEAALAFDADFGAPVDVPVASDTPSGVGYGHEAAADEQLAEASQPLPAEEETSPDPSAEPANGSSADGGAPFPAEFFRPPGSVPQEAMSSTQAAAHSENEIPAAENHDTAPPSLEDLLDDAMERAETGKDDKPVPGATAADDEPGRMHAQTNASLGYADLDAPQAAGAAVPRPDFFSDTGNGDELSVEAPETAGQEAVGVQVIYEELSAVEASRIAPVTAGMGTHLDEAPPRPPTPSPGDTLAALSAAMLDDVDDVSATEDDLTLELDPEPASVRPAPAATAATPAVRPSTAPSPDHKAAAAAAPPSSPIAQPDRFGGAPVDGIDLARDLAPEEDPFDSLVKDLDESPAAPLRPAAPAGAKVPAAAVGRNGDAVSHVGNSSDSDPLPGRGGSAVKRGSEVFTDAEIDSAIAEAMRELDVLNGTDLAATEVSQTHVTPDGFGR